MKACATVSFLIFEVAWIVGIHGVADQQSTRHGHLSELSEQLSSWRLLTLGRVPFAYPDMRWVSTLLATARRR